jgi:hypothetical protein
MSDQNINNSEQPVQTTGTSSTPGTAPGNRTAVVLTVFAAIALAVFAFFQPWLKVSAPFVGEVLSTNAFYTFRHVHALLFCGGGVLIAGLIFIFPALKALGKKKISILDGYICAVANMVIVTVLYAHAYSSLTKQFKEVSTGMAQVSVGWGFYLYLTACIVLIAGITLQRQQFTNNP